MSDTCLLKLAERCEREEASWDLSVDIELAVVPGVVATLKRNPWRVRREADDYCYNPPAYTTSLDAAVTLVPEGFQTTKIAYSLRDQEWSAVVWGGDHTYVGRAKTEVAARVSGALRSRAALVQS